MDMRCHEEIKKHTLIEWLLRDNKPSIAAAFSKFWQGSEYYTYQF